MKLFLLSLLAGTALAVPIQDVEERDAEANGLNFPIPTPTITIPGIPFPTGTGVFTIPPITIPTSFSFPIPTFTPPPLPTIKPPIIPTFTPPAVPTFPWFAN